MVRLDARVVTECTVYLAGCGFAFWKGGWPERFVASVLLVAFILVFAVQNPHRLEAPRFVSLGLDLVILAAVIMVAFRTNLKWPLLGSAFQILSVLTYVAQMIDPSIRSWAYITVDIVLGYGLWATMIYGAVMHMLAQRRMAS